MWDSADPLAMDWEQKAQLESWVRARATPQKIVLRSRICLLAHEGHGNRQIARQLSTSRPTVLLWRNRFAASGVAGLEHEPPRQASRQRLEDSLIKRIVDTTLQTTPPDATHWSTRTLGRKLGVSHMSVARVWDSHGLQPHRVRTFKLSRDKQFVEKLTDIVGLYLNPPDKALVLCVDEKSQIQALDRTQPGLPLKPGRCGTMTHDYVRHGTTTLFAALDVLQGTVIGGCFDRHRHEEFLKFLRQIDRETSRSDNSIWWWIIMQRTNIPRCNHGSSAIVAFIFISRPPVPLGSTWWNDGSEKSRANGFDAAASRVSKT